MAGSLAHGRPAQSIHHDQVGEAAGGGLKTDGGARASDMSLALH